MIFVTAALDQIETNNASNLRASVRIGRDIDSSEARAPQFGPRADAGLERAVGEAPTTDLYFFATFSQCVRADMVKLVFGLRELNQRIGSLLIVILDILKGRKSRDSPC